MYVCYASVSQSVSIALRVCVCTAGDRPSNDPARHLLRRQHRLSGSARSHFLHLLVLQVRYMSATFLMPLCVKYVSKSFNKI